MWIYLCVLLAALTPLFFGSTVLKRRLESTDRVVRAAVSEGGFAATGHRTMQQITDAHVDIVTYLLVVSLAFLYPVGVLKLELLVAGIEGNVLLPVLFAAVVLVWSLFRLGQRLRTVGRLRAGLVTELEVGNRVNELMHQGYYVFHDVPGDDGFIDHVAVGRNGVFVIGSDPFHHPRGSGSGRRVEFDQGWLIYPDGEDVTAIVSVRAQVVWLGTFLTRQLGKSCTPTPVLCLPGWHVELKDAPPFPIVNQKYLAWTIPGWEGQALSAEDVQQVRHVLRARCAAGGVEPELAQAA